MKLFTFRLLLLMVCPIFSFGQPKLREKVLICGVCKDIGGRLHHTMHIMEKIGGLFEDYRILVYENNSKDQTPGLLKRWSLTNPKVIVRCEWCDDKYFSYTIINREFKNQFARTERIARARNIVQDLAMSAEYEEFPYIIWMDMDFKTMPPLDAIVEVFESDREWDAVFAYGIDNYNLHFDWYAFRDKNYPIGPDLLGLKWWTMNKTCALNKTDDWHPVYSGFGGCGIYKKSSMVDCHYSALVTPDFEKVAREIIDEGIKSKHPHVLDYLHWLESVKQVITIPQAVPNLTKYDDPAIGFIVNPNFSNPVIWTMSNYMLQYPSICEHVALHASMSVRGHGKFFINPRLIFKYE